MKSIILAKPQHLELLQKLLNRTQPVDGGGEVILGDEDRVILLDRLGQELCSGGLDANSEPNAYGRSIEELIDLIGGDDLFE